MTTGVLGQKRTLGENIYFALIRMALIKSKGLHTTEEVQFHLYEKSKSELHTDPFLVCQSGKN